ncbi:hypothetical protein [Streptomyces sp. NRRL S-118]|uniref:hypothetical protein n=1 Tax=Streptomyces sp. NRRL S-118 TaxID=1463881 RepID=UPI000A42020D|nr:hypothetical protein [Streptomyces sp. NRRL S-118]
MQERSEAHGALGCAEVGVEHREAIGRLRELAELLEEEYGSVTDGEAQAALNRIAAIDRWHDEERSHLDESE